MSEPAGDGTGGRRVPRVRDGADVTGLPLMPREGFVLSLIDGTTTADELADLSGLDRDSVGEILDKLVDLDAIEWVEVAAPSPSQRPDGERRGTSNRAPASSSKPPRRTATSSQRVPAGGPTETGRHRVARTPSQPARPKVRTSPPPANGGSRQLYDPAELEEPEVDLDVDRRREILDRYYRVESLDHYEALGVPRDAPRDAIRSAYFDQSKRFHPDTEFRKRLGSFRQKMERVFKRLTEAYETLSKKRRRAEYDAYLTAREQTRAAAEALAQGARDADAIVPDPPAEVSSSAPAASGTTTSDAAQPPLDPPDELVLDPPSDPADTGSSPASSDPPRATPASSRSVDPEAARARARELAARRLHSVLGSRRSGGSRGRPKRPGSAPRSAPGPRPSAAAGSSSPSARQDALRGLASSLRQVASVTGGPDRTTRLVREAKEAEDAGDLVSAANSIRRAMAMAPEREDLKTEHARLRSAVAGRLAETYERQARYEEDHGQWHEAAESWARVAEGRPDDPAPRAAAAEAFLEANRDIPQAKLLAEAAVQLAPQSVRARRTLARVYIAAGLTKNARRELEEARKLDPADRIVNNLLEELQG